MSDEKSVVKASLINLEMPESVDTAVKNLSAPPTESAGQFFKDVIDLVVGPFHAFVEKRRLSWQFGVDQFKTDLQKQLDQIPEEKRTVPNMQIAAQTVQDSLFCAESEELRKMFVNLLASSVNSDKVDSVHPSFSGIIRRMTSADANVLMRFKARNSFPVVNYRYVVEQGHSVFEENVMDPRASQEETKSISRSLVVLQSFGLVRLEYERFLVAEGIYSEFDKHPCITAKESYLAVAKARNPLVKDVDYQRGIAELTPLGKQFLEVCT